MIRRGIQFAAMVLFWAVVLGAEWWLDTGTDKEWLRGISRTIKLELQSPDNQGIVYSFFSLYTLAFLWLPRWRLRGHERAQRDGERMGLVVLTALLGLQGLQYWRSYEEAVPAISALTLLTGFMTGCGVAFLLRSRVDTDSLGGAIVGSLAVFLALIALWQPEHAAEFQYRDEARWTGIWKNPNRYGLMMGAGLLISAVFLWQAIWKQEPKRLMTWTWVGAAVLCGIGLLQSFSRGAWLGTAIGAFYLGAVFLRGRDGRDTAQAPVAVKDRRADQSAALRMCMDVKRFANRNRRSLVIGLLAVAVILFWTCRHSEIRPVRRVLSVANFNDFSWRNRLAAYEGALRMMSDRPLAGHGWEQSRELYGSFYAQPRIQEPAAIMLNDYFSLGSMLGFPVLAVFVWTICLNLGGGCGGSWESGSSSAPLSGQVASRAALCVILTGFWFDDGLFYLAPGVPFWTLLAVSGGAERGLRDGGKGDGGPESFRTGRLSPMGALARPRMAAALLLLAGFSCGLVWTSLRDPFERIAFTLTGDDGRRTGGVAFMTKSHQPNPVVVYLHGSRGTVTKDGPTLRLFAELGFAAVSIDYDQSNQKVFDAELRCLSAWLKEQAWARSDSVVWIGSSLGAQRSLSHLLRNPEVRPQFYVRVGGGLVDEAKESSGEGLTIGCPALLLHGGNDRIFPATDCDKLAGLLRKGGTPAGVIVLPKLAHGFRPDRQAVMRALAEICAERLGAVPSGLTNRTPTCWFVWIPVALAFGWRAFALKNKWLWLMRADMGPSTGAEWVFRFGASAAAIGAVLFTGICLALPRMEAKEELLRRTVEWGIVNADEADAEFLGRLEVSGAGSTPTVSQVLEHAELAGYRGRFLHDGLDDEIWRRHVVSPVISGNSGRLNWRRPLWENFYPRVRKEASPMSAAVIVCRFLRERVSIVGDAEDLQGVLASWHFQRANPRDWERLYVASLRSACVAARVSDNGKAEIWNGKNWQSAPRPVVDRLSVELE